MPEIALADDVVFSGESLEKIIDGLKTSGVTVKEVLSAVCVKDTFERFKDCGLEIKTGFLIDNVVDQVCERDFYFGVPQSGMATVNSDGQILKSPYFSPFGSPIERASIPIECEKDFSIGCVDRSIELWRDIELESNKKIFVGELPEKIYNTSEEDLILNTLESARSVLEMEE